MEFKDINDYKIKKYVGSGRTAKCYLTEEDDILKIYRKLIINKKLKKCISLEEIIKLNKLDSINVVAPSEIILKNDKFIGYKTRYIDAKPISHLKNDVKIKEIVEARKKFMENIYHIGNNYNFSFLDVHDDNILYDGNFYIIDLDLGMFDLPDSEIRNRMDISLTILYALFQERYFELLFTDYKLQVFLTEMMNNNDTFDLFCERLYEIFNSDELTIKDLKRKKVKILRP